jgi:ABC-type uncharacterized transport system permease subunit
MTSAPEEHLASVELEALVDEAEEQRQGHPLRVAARKLLVPLLALLVALLVGALLIALTIPGIFDIWGSDPAHALSLSISTVGDAYWALLTGAFGSSSDLSRTVTQMTPLIFVGLSASYSFRAGVFNIGAQGQLLLGGVVALIVGINFNSLPAALHIVLVLIGGLVGGAAWGLVPGLLKARSGANEVITTLMLNYVAVYFVNWLLVQKFLQRPGRTEPISKQVDPSVMLPSNLIGLGIALATAVAVWWFLFRSTAGFELRAVGENSNAASYAGIRVGRTYVYVMLVSGALAGLAGFDLLLGNQGFMVPAFSGSYGFDAITVAIVGGLDPLGVVLASLLLGVLRSGAINMEASTNVPSNMITIIQAIVIVFMASPFLVREIFRIRDRGVARSFSKGWAA